MAGRTCLNKILIPLQSLVSCFLEPPANRRVAVGATEGLWRGPGVSQRHYLLGPSSWGGQAGGGSSVLTLLCAKNQANENREHWSDI